MSGEKFSGADLRVAVIGSGPAGFYTAEGIFKRTPSARVDMFDALPTPHGLVRHGVAPDHQKIKTVARVYDKTASSPGFRFFGFVEFGKDLSLAELKRFYHQIVFATGAQESRKMGIPGEDLIGSRTATDFVAWYNGHPYFSHLDFDLSCERALIIGAGNVAADVARILCLSARDLAKTDIAGYALKKLAASRIKEVFIIGRRGPAQAAFTNPELRELGKIDGTDAQTAGREMRLDPVTAEFMRKNPDPATEKKLEILRSFTAKKSVNEKPSDASGRFAAKNGNKILRLRFFLSPEKIEEKNGKVSGAVFSKNILAEDEGKIVARPSGKTERIGAGIVFRSIGYAGAALKDVPFDEKNGVIPNSSGRVTDKPGSGPVRGLYTAGWIKRGASGVIGTNKSDSAETVRAMIEDFSAGAHIKPDEPENSIEKLLDEKKPGYVSYRKWSAVDEKETARGRKIGRPRVKYTSIEAIMKAIEK